VTENDSATTNPFPYEKEGDIVQVIWDEAYERIKADEPLNGIVAE
jgi:hypothetical protein